MWREVSVSFVPLKVPPGSQQRPRAVDREVGAGAKVACRNLGDSAGR